MSEESKKPTDWERVEADYRAGILSLREIGAAHGISHVAISKRAKRDGWTRDLAAKIKAKADALVTKEAVTSEVTAAAAVTERAIVDANAKAVADIRLAHRADISRARRLCLALVEELEAVTGERLSIEVLQDLVDSVKDDSDAEAVTKIIDRAKEALNKAMSLPSRAGTMKALSESLKTLVTLERDAWGLGEADSSPPEASADDVSADQAEAAYARMRG